MIAALLLGLLFIIVTSAFLFFLLYILYPSLAQQNFPVNDPLSMPWPPGWADTATQSLFLFNSPADCHVIKVLYSNRIDSGIGGRQDVCKGFEKCVDICPRLNFAESPQNRAPGHTCVFEREMELEYAKHNRIFVQKLSAIRNRMRNKMRGKT
jgi:hypothetical protein